VICVNLAGVLTFVAQGLRPLSWWEAKRARQATIFAIVTWAILLAILILLIYLELNDVRSPAGEAAIGISK
jgi:hypothetical protein